MPARRIVLDGRPYDERRLGEAAAQRIPNLIATPEGTREGDLFGFSAVHDMETWLNRQGLFEAYDEGRVLTRRARRSLVVHDVDEDEDSELRRLQRRTVTAATSKLKRALLEAGVEQDAKEMNDLILKYDPVSGPIIHSVTVYKHCGYEGSLRVFPSGWAFPYWSWFRFNDVASSAKAFGVVSVLYNRTRFRSGKKLWLWGATNVSCFKGWPYYFNDIASSSIHW